jgi:3-oxoacyl-[acyl-carrier protein] reductase
VQLNLSNKVIFVAGSSKGIGKGIAKEFLNEGAKVVITGRNKEDLQDT